MLRKSLHSSAQLMAGLLLLAGHAGTAGAVDGVIEINQTRALAGGVTGGDGAGFPVTLDAPGSYRLTGNLDVSTQPSPGNVTAIEVTADNVRIDLNGFSILGPNTCSGIPPSCTASGTGVGVDALAAAVNGTVVLNGNIVGMGGAGINVLTGSQVEGVLVREVGGFGIFAGAAATVRGNRVYLIGGTQGITGGVGAVIRDNSVIFTAGTGIVHPGSGAITGNALKFGTVGISATNSVVRDNAVESMSSFGLSLTGTSAGYVNNVLIGNNSGGNQVSGGLQMGTNICDGSTVCP